MRIDVGQASGILVVTPVVDFLDAKNAEKFEGEVEALMVDNSRIVINLSQLKDLDSNGLGSILSLSKKQKHQAGELRLCCMSESVQTICRLVRLDKVLDIFDTEEEAVNFLH